jgi:GTP pyrophosphokinase
MPTGSTALDFAFSIHTFLGSHCIGAKVNHKLVPLSHKLQSGDQVEILTSKAQHVQPAWINYVSSAKAKAKIQSILRRDGRELQKAGEEKITEFLADNGIAYSLEVVDSLAMFHDINRREDFFQAVGEKTILLSEKDIDELKGKKGKGWRKFVPFIGKGKDSKKAVAGNNDQQQLFIVPEKFNRKKPIFVSDTNIQQYVFPSCCHPIPGDDILGFIDNKHQIEIHIRACPVADKLKTSYGNRILDAKWDMHKKLYFDATIRLAGIDRIGMLRDMAEVISNLMNVNMRKLTITTNEGVFEGVIDIRIHDRDDLKDIINNLKKIPDLQDVTQIM